MVDNPQPWLLDNTLADKKADASFQINRLPLIKQNDSRLAGNPYLATDVKTVTDGDCYGTSTEVSISTAIANRFSLAATPKLPSRTHQFWNLKNYSTDVSTKGPAALPNAGTSMPDDPPWVGESPDIDVDRLAWLQEWFGDRLSKLNASAPHSYSLAEALADFAPPFQSTPDPRAFANQSTEFVLTNGMGAVFLDDFTMTTCHVTNGYIKRLIDNGFVVIFGYQWTKPCAVRNDKSGTYQASFIARSEHKVVFSGYAKDWTYGADNNATAVPADWDKRFCLRVMNPGQGTTQKARLVYDLTDRVLGSVPPAGQVLPKSDAVDKNSIAFDGTLGSRFYLDFAARQQAVAGTDEFAVGFAQFLHAISLRWTPPYKSWSGQWEKSRTGFCTWQTDNGPLLFTFEPKTQSAHVDRIVPGGIETISSNKLPFDPDSQFMSFMRFEGDPGPHLMVYEPSGETPILRVEGGLALVTKLKQPKGRSHFVPIVLDNKIGVLFCDSSLGCFAASQLPGFEDDPVRGPQYGKDCLSLVGFAIDKAPRLLAVSAAGQAEYGAVAVTKSIYPDFDIKVGFTKPKPSPPFSPGTIFASPPYLGLPHFFAYTPSSGALEFRRIDKIGASSTSLWWGTTGKNFKKAFAFELGTNVVLGLYDPDSGHAEYWTAIPL